MDGILLVNKRKGWTSFDVVNCVKGITRERKVGHLGTLDPMATGVLPITLGNATKLFEQYLSKTKTYVAEFTFGFTTDSLDLDGKIIAENKAIPSLNEIEASLPQFIGKIKQLPPAFSAKRINGKHAYELARNGEDVKLEPKEIEIFSLEILNYQDGKLSIKIDCGSGTYIRAIARDIAEHLETVACMTALERIRVGTFFIENCIDIKTIEKSEIEKYIIKN